MFEDLSKTWEKNEKRDRAIFLEKLFKDGPTHQITNQIQDPIGSENLSSSSRSPRKQIPNVDPRSSPKHSPRLTPLLFTPALPNSL